MNPTTEPTAPPPAVAAAQAPPLLPPQPPLQPHRSSTSCDRHPEENFTGFCPFCLCERLAVLDPNSSASSSSARKPPTSSTAVAALKAIFRPSSGAGGGAGRSNRPPTSSSSSSSFFPELRRTKSFSASKNEGLSGVFEPQRKSCDVRVRSSLWNLFNQDNERKASNKEASRVGGGGGGGHVEVENRNLAPSSSVQGPVVESKEEEENKNENQEENVEDDKDEIRVVEEPNAGNLIEDRVQEIVKEEKPKQEAEEELKSMKDHIDQDSQTKKTGSFWSAASVFSKKLQKWRQKQKMKKCKNGDGTATLPVEKPIGRQFRETQSEIADYGFGRRSCDIDPRFSLDAGRMSFDDPRYSLDEPRASWDGYLIGRTFPRMPLPTMLSVVEDAPVHVVRTDAQIPVEEPMNSIDEDGTVPGGSAQTREYYSDSSRRRKSLDRSNSIRKTAAAVVAEMNEVNSVSSGNANANANANAKVTPAFADYIHGPKMVIPDRDLKDSNSNSLRDDCSETFEIGVRDTASVTGNGDRKGSKKSRRWSKGWNFWGFINRRGSNNDEDEDRDSRANGVERSYSESWQEFRGDHHGDNARGAFNPKMFRSNSSVSWRNAQNIGASFGTMRNNGIQGNGHGKKARDEFVLERNRSARYSDSPNNLDHGLLRLYLTPMSRSQRNGSGKSRSNQAHSIARSMLRLY